MTIKLLKVLAAISIIFLFSSAAIAQSSAPGQSAGTVETTKPAPVQALDKANEAVGAVEAQDDEVSRDAATITDDEGMADEDMEMPEEDLDDAPIGAQAE